MHNREFKFGYQHFLLCQKSFLKVSSKWLLKNKSDNGKLLLGKTYSGERFRAILALLFSNLSVMRDFFFLSCRRYRLIIFFTVQAMNPFPNKTWFLHACNVNLMKTLWEKEKLLETSNFSFSYSVFYPFG